MASKIGRESWLFDGMRCIESERKRNQQNEYCVQRIGSDRLWYNWCAMHVTIDDRDLLIACLRGECAHIRDRLEFFHYVSIYLNALRQLKQQY